MEIIPRTMLQVFPAVTGGEGGGKRGRAHIHGCRVHLSPKWVSPPHTHSIWTVQLKGSFDSIEWYVCFSKSYFHFFHYILIYLAKKIRFWPNGGASESPNALVFILWGPWGSRERTQMQIIEADGDISVIYWKVVQKMQKLTGVSTKSEQNTQGRGRLKVFH